VPVLLLLLLLSCSCCQAKRVLGDVNFMRSLEEFDKDNIPDAVIKKLRRYIDDPNYQPDVVAKQSRAAMSLCMWTRAMDVYNRCVQWHAS
jgi:dynein heavy chain